MRNHWTNAALFCTGLYLAAFTGQAQAQVDCADWNTSDFFKVATGPDVMRCLGQGADIEARAEGGFTPLHHAAANSTAEAINALIDAGTLVDVRGESGGTPLHAAAANGTAEAINALLNAGADIEARAERDRTPLHAAAANGTAEAINALLNAGADIYARDFLDRTPLQLAERYSPNGAGKILRAARAKR